MGAAEPRPWALARWAALAEKEIRHHSLALIATFAIVIPGWFICFLNVFADESRLTWLDVHARFVVIFLPILVAVLGHRLIVQEFFNRTQLFLEALPLSRPEMLGGKFLFGAGVIALINGISFGLAWIPAALHPEPLTGNFIAMVLVRSQVFLWTLWSFCFVMGLLGRWRVPLYVLFGMVMLVLTTVTELRLELFGPFYLANPSQIIAERQDWPVRALIESLACIGLFSGIGFGLGLINEGSLAEQLSQKMSRREKAACGVILLLGVAAFGVLEERKTKPPFRFTDEAVIGGDPDRSDQDETLFRIQYQKEEWRPRARALLERLESEFAVVSSALHLDSGAAVRIALNRRLDGATYEQAKLKENDGLLIRANFLADKEWDESDFVAYVLTLSLVERSDRRVAYEPKAWMIEGFPLWWMTRSRRKERERILCQAALSAAEADFQPSDLQAWRRLHERAGPDGSQAIAVAGLVELERLSGTESVLKLARAMLAKTFHEDIRDTIYDWRHPMPEVFESIGGPSWSSFLEVWRDALGRRVAEGEARAVAGRLGRGRIKVELDETGGTPKLEVELEFDQPPARGVIVTLLHCSIGPFDHIQSRRSLIKERVVWSEGKRTHRFVLTGGYNRGSRAFLAVELKSLDDRVTIRRLARRVSLP